MRAPRKQTVEPEVAPAPRPEHPIGDTIAAAAGAARGILTGRLALALICIAGGIVGGLIIAASEGWWVPPAIFQTRGDIYVASPEVYTRERLVNDRYDEDYWLHHQLDRLDQTTSLVTGTDVSSLLARMGLRYGAAASAGGEGKAATAEKAPGKPSGEEALPRPGSDFAFPFDQDFLIRSGIRDAIRQLILENLLDDRHDLTGNSVYGLKFDISVIPGSQTYSRAFIHVSVKANDPISTSLLEPAPSLVATPPKPAGRTVDEFKDVPDPSDAIKREYDQYYGGSIVSYGDPRHPLYGPRELYEDWLRDVQARLNSYEDQINDVRAAARACGNGRLGAVSPYVGDAVRAVLGLRAGDAWADDVVDAVGTVLGTGAGVIVLPKQDFDKSNRRRIALPDPWDRYLSLSVMAPGPDACQEPPRFQVDEISDSVLLSHDYLVTQGYNQISKFPKGLGVFYLAGEPKYRNVSSLAGYLAKTGRLGASICLRRRRDECEADGVRLAIPAGFFNFLEAVGRRDQYTYALFPKAEVAGFLAARSIDAGGDVGAAGAGGGGDASLAFRRDREEAQTIPRSIGFSDSSTSPDRRSIDFGWVIGGGEQVRATQKSGFALISVPAWTNQLSVTVETGWLTSGGTEVSKGEPYEITVPIPPDYETFDSFVVGGVRHEPRILNDLMGNPNDPSGTGDPTDLAVTACENASIVIPGYRLWRSTVVTLGGQKADRITVLPNMRGIIAEFQPLDPPPSPSESKDEGQWLRVWTSEGVDTARTRVRVLKPADPTHCSKPTAAAPPAPPVPGAMQSPKPAPPPSPKG